MDLILACTTFHPAPGISSWGSPAGDAAHAALGLAKGLRVLGHRATLVAPFEAHHAHAGIGFARRLSPLSFDVGGVRHERIVFDAKLSSGVEIVLLGHEPPGEATSKEDAAVRCAWFGHAVAALARQRLGVVAPRSASEPELEAVIAIGEESAFVPFAIREDAKLPSLDGGPSPRLLAGLARITIPLDLQRDVRLPRHALGNIGVGEDLFSPEGVEFYGEISLSKAAAIASDRLVALGESPRASFVQVSSAHKLDGVFRARGADLVSIGSGVDHAQYNPATDPHVVSRFDPEDLGGKSRGKATLLAELELEPLAHAPLLVLLAGEAAPAAVGPALDRALRGELSLIIATSKARSDGELPAALDRVARAHPGRVAIRHDASEPLLHRLLAAADFSLVFDAGATATPVTAAMRYATIPIARKSPAVDDAIVDVDAALQTGTGFVFDTLDELFGTLQRAVSAYELPAFRKLQRRVMRHESGWERPARKLEHLIQQIEG